MKLIKEEAIIEAILFASGEAVSAHSLAEALGVNVKEAKIFAESLLVKYKDERRGVHILQIEDGYQMCTNPNYFDYIKKIHKTTQNKPLTPTIMETLAIIAYKQPITKGQIEDVRGVSADHAVNKLLEIGLVVEVGRSDLPQKPIMFGTSDMFLRHFGMSKLSQLPELNADFEKAKLETYAEIEIGSLATDIEIQM